MWQKECGIQDFKGKFKRCLQLLKCILHSDTLTEIIQLVHHIVIQTQAGEIFNYFN